MALDADRDFRRSLGTGKSLSFVRHQGEYVVSDKQSETRQKYLGVGISLGVAIGAGLGVALGNLALGIGPGIALGVAFGMILGNRHAKAMEQSSQKEYGHDA